MPMEKGMEHLIINMDDLSKGELFYRAMMKVLTSISQGKLRFFAPSTSGHHASVKPANFFYPPESHDTIEIAFCLKNRVNFYINNTKVTLSSGPVNVLLPGDVHAERFYKSSLGYQVFWILILPEYVGFLITCYEPNRGYFLLGRRVNLLLESRQTLLALGRRQLLHDDPLMQIQFHFKLMEILLASLPLIRQVPDHQARHFPFSSYLLEQLKHHLDSHFCEEISLASLKGLFHYSPSYLNMLFRKKHGLPILKYILHKRVDFAERMLKTTDQEIKQISFQAGFRDPLYFSRIFRQIKGRPPSDYRK
jgi:AraC-like DNA-binding protein